MSIFFSNRNYLIVGIFISWLIQGCTSKKPKVPDEIFPTPPSYNLNYPITYKLPTELDEISGIVYYPKDSSIFAIHDERGWLYKVHLGEKIKIEKWKYTAGADFEDLGLVDSNFYTLKSAGGIVEFRIFRPDSVIKIERKLPKSPKKEFEAMYYDSANHRLLAICKDCEADIKNTASVFAFDIAQKKWLDSPAYVIDVEKIEKKFGDKISKFKPSAAAINPMTGELYIISSVNKLLVIADANGKAEDVYPLNPKVFKQPEGLAFTPKGDLLISNEAADIGVANILLFKYKEIPKQ
ncbi:MAG TPA: SdiA-regulated domain-containing protein [Chitinophagaceae bacterium]|nr:SdiA-regulated domain-containing protein [Chitinophagaceae bacterium]